MDLFSLLRARVTCTSGLHSWSAFEPDKAARCCNGWAPVRVPWQYRYHLYEWAALRDQPYNPYTLSWTVVLIPATAVDLIAQLRARVPDWIWGFYAPMPASRIWH